MIASGHPRKAFKAEVPDLKKKLSRVSKPRTSGYDHCKVCQRFDDLEEWTPQYAIVYEMFSIALFIIYKKLPVIFYEKSKESKVFF